MKFIIKRIDDETTEFYIDKIRVGCSSHDYDGWSGMESLENLFIAIAEHLDIPLIVKE